jgi:hypothetical protein
MLGKQDTQPLREPFVKTQSGFLPIQEWQRPTLLFPPKFSILREMQSHPNLKELLNRGEYPAKSETVTTPKWLFSRMALFPYSDRLLRHRHLGHFTSFLVKK